MSDEALARAIAAACLGAGDASDLRGLLEAHGVAEEDIAAILAAPRRLAVYRSLVRNGLSAVIAKILPRTRARMAAEAPGRFEEDVAAFVDEVGPRTHYLRDVPAELFAWAEPRWRASTDLPAYLADLAAFELAHFAVAAAPDADDAPSAAPPGLALDRGLAFHPSARLLRLAWAVHELPVDDEAALVDPAARDAILLGYRDAEHAVRWLELTPLAAAVIERLLMGDALGEAVSQACAARGADVGAALPDIARLLADLGARGIVLEAR
jgi:hypothetical protein